MTLLCPALLCPTLAGGSGDPFQTPLSQGDARMTALTTDAGGEPVLAWVEVAAGGKNAQETYGLLHAARWDGKRWERLGGVLNENPLHNAWQLSAVHGPDGYPWLGWAEDAGTAHVDSYLLSRWDGRRWSGPGGYAVRRNLSDAGKSRAFTVTKGNLPYLTWTNIYYPGAFAQVVQPFYWQAQQRVWKQNTPPLNHTIRHAAFFPAAARGPHGTLYTAWLEGDVAHSDVFVSQLGQGERWTRLGGALNVRPHTYTFSPQLAAGAWGVLAAWQEDQGGIDNLFVKRWDGARWLSLGASLNADVRRMAARPNLALDAAGYPLLAWVEGEDGSRRVYARRWNGHGWRVLGGGALNPAGQDVRSASVTVDRQGRAVVAWCQGQGARFELRVRRF